MKHEDYIEQIYSLIDGLLTTEEEEEIREHLSKCESCRTLHHSVVSDDRALGEGLDALAGREELKAKILESANRLKDVKRTRWLRYSIADYLWSGKTAYAAAAVVLVVMVLSTGISYLHERANRFGRITMLSGLAYCSRGDVKFQLSSGDTIDLGDEIYTDSGGKIHLLTVDNQIVTLNEMTHLEIGENKERQNLKLVRGEIFIDTSGSGRKYSIEALGSEVRNAGTKFDIRVMPDQFPSVVSVAVEEGRASVQGKDGKLDMKSGEKVTLIEDRVAQIEQSASLEEVMKWRWTLHGVSVDPLEVVWEKEDPYTGAKWVAVRKRFVMPESAEAKEYEVILNLVTEMRRRFGSSVEATSIAFTENYIYIGSIYGILRYNRGSGTLNMIIPDYEIIGSEITEIAISEDGQVFDISYRRPGSKLVEHLATGIDSFPIIVNFDLFTLEPLASAR